MFPAASGGRRGQGDPSVSPKVSGLGGHRSTGQGKARRARTLPTLVKCAPSSLSEQEGSRGLLGVHSVPFFLPRDHRAGAFTCSLP